MIATLEATTVEVCKHNASPATCVKCKKAAYDAARRVAKNVVAVEPEVVAEPVAVEPEVVAAIEPVAPIASENVGIVQIFNQSGMVFEMPAGPKASSECRHRELDTLLAHVAVPVGTSNDDIAELLAAREVKFMARPKIQRLLVK